MQNKSFLPKTRWLVTILALFFIGVSNVLCDTYTLITSNGSLSNDDKVILATKSNNAPSLGVTGQSGSDATVSTTGSEWVQYTVKSASNSGWQLKTGNTYIASPGNNNKFVYGTAATCSVNANGVLMCNSRYLCQNGTYYRMYGSIGTYTPFYVWKVTTASCDYTEASSLSTGDEILIVYESGATHKQLSTATETADFTTCASTTYKLTVETGYNGSNLALKNSAGKYLAWSSSTSCSFVDNKTDATRGTKVSWTTTTSKGTLVLQNVNSSRYLMYKTSDASVRAYAALNQSGAALFKIYKLSESCGKPTAVGTKNGSISKTGFTATWTAPSSAPANGYYVAYSTSLTTPGDITASSGDYTVVSVGAGTTEKAISSLTDGGLYYFWVRSRCSASDNSGWSDRASVQLSKITLNQTSLTGMTYVYNGASGGPSSQTKSFTVTGTNVGGNLTVSAPTNFQVSTDNSSWGSSKTITATSGSASGTVYVRLAGGLNAGSYGSASTYVTVSDGGSKASSKNVSVQGSVTKATLNPSFGSAIYNITRDVSTSTSFTLTNVPSDYTGDITYQRTNSPTYSSYLTVDGSEKTFTASRSGSWTVTAQFTADANYNAKASGVTCTVNAVMRDTYVDNVNGQSVTEAQRTDDGVNPYTSPSLSDVAAGSACKGTKTHLIGWATATFIANVGNGTLTGADSDYTQANGFYAVGETLPAASGATYYAVYGEEE